MLLCSSDLFFYCWTDIHSLHCFIPAETTPYKTKQPLSSMVFDSMIRTTWRGRHSSRTERQIGRSPRQQQGRVVGGFLVVGVVSIMMMILSIMMAHYTILKSRFLMLLLLLLLLLGCWWL